MMGTFRLFCVCVCLVSVASGQQQQLPSQDIMALLEFKRGIKHDPTGFVLDSWTDDSIQEVDGCPSSWNGIMCNGGNVAALALDDLGLVADLDLSVFTNLTMLVTLSISNNSISGRLPLNLGNFKRLEYLDISDNLFFSSLPLEIGKLESLKNLSLAGNNFSGPIPDTISGLVSIRSLDMSRNSLSEPLPASLTKLGGLVYLNLSLNAFTGNIPKGFELMEKLDVLDLHGNMLDGRFDPEILLLTAASHVDLGGNLLASSAKKQQKFLTGVSPSVMYLNLSHNQLTGSLISSVEALDLGTLKVLDLSYNQLSGELPAFNFVYDLQVLRLSNNRFSGFIPDNLLKGDSLVLTELDLSGNNLSGSVTTVTSTTLHTLNLSSNRFSGELPLLTGSCAVVDLSKNELGGTLTRMLKWGNVEVLDLSQNKLTGSIPEVTAQFLRLNSLNLSHNSLNASLPKVIGMFPKLTALDLSFNQLDGPLLSTLLTSATLKELHLRGNKLYGNIDLSRSSSSDSNLQVIDLSYNKLSGSLPDEFGSFVGLQVLNIEGNNFSGSLPASVCNISALNSLDIARNNFTGPLPKNFSNSLQTFNASYNDLSGVVPESLRKFPRSSFYPGNSGLQFPNPPGDNNASSRNECKKYKRNIIKIVIIVACAVVAVIILALLAIFICRKRTSRMTLPTVTNKDASREASIPRPGKNGGSGMDISAKDLAAIQKESPSEVVSPDEKIAAMAAGFSPSKTSHLSWSPESGESYTAESLSRLDVKSPDQLGGDLYFLDDTVAFTADELSRAPAEVLGRSSHGTSYKATLENGQVLTVKWLREGIAKQRKEFAREAKRLANIRHPNVVGLRGYYWGPTQHEKLILSNYISPGNLAGFLYDRPGRKTLPLTWAQRFKIAVDVARGLNYLHFDRAVPHGNLKASNVLLDGPDLIGKVADYCLHRLMTQSGTTEQILDAGVLGYCAPELAASTKKPVPSFKSDVYTFGVILLELITGKCAGDVVSNSLDEDGGVGLTEWVGLRVSEGRGCDCFDPALTDEMSSSPAVNRGMNEVLEVALRCIRPVSERPGIKAVYEDLSAI